MCVTVCVRACVRAYVYVCINVTSQNNVVVATCKTQYYIMYYSWKYDKISSL